MDVNRPAVYDLTMFEQGTSGEYREWSAMGGDSQDEPNGQYSISNTWSS